MAIQSVLKLNLKSLKLKSWATLSLYRAASICVTSHFWTASYIHVYPSFFLTVPLLQPWHKHFTHFQQLFHIFPKSKYINQSFVCACISLTSVKLWRMLHQVTDGSMNYCGVIAVSFVFLNGRFNFGATCFSESWKIHRTRTAAYFSVITYVTKINT